MGRWASLVRRAPRDLRMNAALVLMLVIAAVIGVPQAAASSAHLAIGHHGTTAMQAAAHQPGFSSDAGAEHGHRQLHADGAPVHLLQPEPSTGNVSFNTVLLPTATAAVVPTFPVRPNIGRQDPSALQVWRQ